MHKSEERYPLMHHLQKNYEKHKRRYEFSAFRKAERERKEAERAERERAHESRERTATMRARMETAARVHAESLRLRKLNAKARAKKEAKMQARADAKAGGISAKKARALAR